MNVVPCHGRLSVDSERSSETSGGGASFEVVFTVGEIRFLVVDVDVDDGDLVHIVVVAVAVFVFYVIVLGSRIVTAAVVDEIVVPGSTFSTRRSRMLAAATAATASVKMAAGAVVDGVFSDRTAMHPPVVVVTTVEPVAVPTDVRRL